MRIEIRRIQQQFGITSIYVTHDQSEAMTVSDRIMVMDKGVIQQLGTPFEIYSRPRNRFVADFIGRANFIEGRVKSAGETLSLDIGGKCQSFPSYNSDIVVGRKGCVVIRPEGLALGAPSPSSFFNGTVSHAVYLGATMEYEISVEGRETPVIAVSHNPVKEGFFRVGDVVGISFDPVSAHVIAVE